jgi:hypothetical protein
MYSILNKKYSSIQEMFESEDDDDLKLDSSMNTAESDDKEINVMDMSPLKDDFGLKRKIDTPLDFKLSFTSDHGVMTNIMDNEESNSGFKFKLKVSVLKLNISVINKSLF